MNRRAFIRAILASGVAHTLDLDKLLWIPGQKKIFLPTVTAIDWGNVPSYSAIIALEMERIAPRIRQLFERDDMFYRALAHRVTKVDCGIEPIRIPLHLMAEHKK